MSRSDGALHDMTRRSSQAFRMAAFLIALLIVVLIPISFARAEVITNGVVTGSYVNVRQSPTSVSGTPIVTVLYCGHRVQTLAVVPGATDPAEQWHQVVVVDLDGVEKYGYIRSDLILPDSATPIDPISPFEISIAAFPESYKTGLRALHARYPNWVFQPLSINLDWNTVLFNETLVGRSLIESSVNDSWQSTYTKNDATLPGWTPSARDAYNWLTDSYITYDGSRWVNTAPEYVAYSMDPRNFLSDTQVFQFLQLSYDSSSQNIETVQTMLTGTFMEAALIKNFEGADVTYAQTIMDASNTYQVNPYFLVARMKQEILLSDPPGQPCDIASGTYSGYEGYYNFYGIGATPDPTPKDSVVNALKYAKGVNKDGSVSTTYLRPWNSQYKAILGGAMWIENGYIAKGQDTLYFQRFHVIDYGEGLYWHQYMTSTQAPVSEALRLKVAYENLTHLPLSFKIPVYLNMPEQRVETPWPKGNPNNWLTSISVGGQALTPSFDPNIFQYDIIVGSSVESVSISATTVNSLAMISGVGVQPLTVGLNPIKLVVTAQDLSVREYNLNIVRLDPSVEPQFETTYSLNNQNISGIDEGTTIETFLQQFFMVEGMMAKAFDATGNEIIPDGVRTMRTGDQMRVLGPDNVVVNIYPVVIFGDANGDGKISSSDLTLILRHVLGENTLTGPNAIAANANHDTKVSSSDLTLILRHILDETTINQRGTT